MSVFIGAALRHYIHHPPSWTVGYLATRRAYNVNFFFFWRALLLKPETSIAHGRPAKVCKWGPDCISICRRCSISLLVAWKIGQSAAVPRRKIHCSLFQHRVNTQWTAPVQGLFGSLRLMSCRPLPFQNASDACNLTDLSSKKPGKEKQKQEGLSQGQKDPAFAPMMRQDSQTAHHQTPMQEQYPSSAPTPTTRCRARRPQTDCWAAESVIEHIPALASPSLSTLSTLPSLLSRVYLLLAGQAAPWKPCAGKASSSAANWTCSFSW